MKLLYIIPYAPNLIRVRSYNLIRFMAARGHEVTVSTLWSDERERLDSEDLRQYVPDLFAHYLPRWRSFWNCLLALPGKRPLQSEFCWQPELNHQILQRVTSHNGHAGFDVIHVEHLRGAKYGLSLKKALRENGNSIPVVWDSVDNISYLFRQASQQSRSFFGRWLTRLELKRTESYEAWIIRQFDQVLVTSPHDQQAFFELLDEKKPTNIQVLANGVDLEYFSPNGQESRSPNTLVVSGKMSYHANVAMVQYLVEKILPMVWAKKPNVNLWIVGKDPPREILALSQNPAITVTGTVPDIRQYLRQATIAVVPILYGAGIQNKVLEAMACGTPVVSSPQAVSALQTIEGQDIFTAQDPTEFANTILRLLDDPELREKTGSAGRQYVETHHNWHKIVEQLESIYQLAKQNTKNHAFKPDYS